MVGESAATVPIENLAEEFLARYRRGELPAITEYVAAHPALAEEIRELFPTLLMLERVSPQSEEVSGRIIAGKVGSVVPKQLGEYRILREIGRGGMGIVYEAEQVTLGRHVALKVLPTHALLTPNLLRRFQNEARAAARLHHTNIVPVFGVGEDQGIHYYAMQFIQGHGLDEVLEELRRLRRNQEGAARRAGDPLEEEPDPLKEEPPAKPLSRIIAKRLAAGEFASEARRPGESDQELDSSNAAASSQSEDSARCTGCSEPLHVNESSELLCHSLDGSTSGHSRSHGIYVRSVARMGLQAAEALAHAHSQGVLHRDIKPSNLLLDAHGAVWITDFGLAKQEGSDLTHSGDVVGTLRYLAPERFRGTSDARTDIYGLGVTLYELLTTRPVFTTTDRHRLIHDIAHLEPTPPRRLEPRVPRDLETIVLKAMVKESAGRYATADEMAADLRRFLDDQPIAARRASIVERVWRWCARRPALAAMSLALLVSLAIGFGGVLWQWSRAERQKKLLAGALLVTQSERQRAERNLDEASHHRTIAQREADRADVNYRAARQAVDELLTIVSEDELKNQPGLQVLRLRLLTRALDYDKAMVAQRPNDPQARLELAASYARVAAIKTLVGSPGEAIDGYQKAVDLFETALAESAEDRQTAMQLVGACNDLSLLLIDDHEFAEARRRLDRARALIEPLAEANPGDAEFQGKLALTLINVSWCVSQAPAADRRLEAEKAIELLQPALAIYRRLLEQSPGDYRLARFVSITLYNLARRNIDARHFEKAEEQFEESLQIRLQLTAQKPNSIEMQAHVAAAYNGLADAILRSPRSPEGWFEKALHNYEKSLEMQERLARENPAVVSYGQDAIGTLLNLSELYYRHNEIGRALELRCQANEAWELRIAQGGASLSQQIGWLGSVVVQAEYEHRLERYADALASWLRAREVWRQVQGQPAVTQHDRDVAIRNLTGLMQELGFRERPAEAYTMAAEARELADGRPQVLLNLSWALEQSVRGATRGAALDDEAKAAVERCLDLALAMFQEGAKGAPERVVSFLKPRPGMGDYQALLTLEGELAKDADNVDALLQRCELLDRLGRFRHAEADRLHAFQLLDAALARSPEDTAALRQRTFLHSAAGHWTQAIADATRFLEARSKDREIVRRRAVAAVHLGDWERAHADYGRLIAQPPKNASFLLSHSRAAFELGQAEDVATDLRRLRELVGSDAALATAISWRMVGNQDSRRFPDDVLWCAQRAVELAPGPDRRIALGGVYCQLGRDGEAVDLLTRPDSQSAGGAEAARQFWLAICYQHLGEHQQAHQAYQRALRSWKQANAISEEREAHLKTLRQEAEALLGG